MTNMHGMDDDAARQALSDLIDARREDYAGLSRLLGRNPAYIQQYIRRGTPRRLAEQDRRTLARYFNVSEQALGGPGEAPVAGTDLIAIPRFRVEASAGAGSFAEGERGHAEVGFSRDFLERIGPSRARDLSIIRVDGDSMMPTLSDGDDIMVDRSVRHRRLIDGIYVLRRDDTLLVKRITVNPATSTLTIASDNPAYASWHDCSPDDVDIIGRVVWAGRRIR